MQGFSIIEELSDEDREDIAEILKRRANEIASFHSNYTDNKDHFGSVEMALSREIERLRNLADRLKPKVE